MRHIIFNMQFKGMAAPTGEEGVMKANTSATSCSMKSVIGEDGVEGAFAPAEGGMAFFESEVRMTDAGRFVEKGSISFGDDHTLEFSTVGEGILEPSADPQTMTGAVIWKIETGAGQFHNASGYITSNFSVSAAGEVTDHQFGSIYVP